MSLQSILFYSNYVSIAIFLLLPILLYILASRIGIFSKYNHFWFKFIIYLMIVLLTFFLYIMIYLFVPYRNLINVGDTYPNLTNIEIKNTSTTTYTSIYVLADDEEAIPTVYTPMNQEGLAPQQSIIIPLGSAASTITCIMTDTSTIGGTVVVLANVRSKVDVFSTLPLPFSFYTTNIDVNCNAKNIAIPITERHLPSNANKSLSFDSITTPIPGTIYIYNPLDTLVSIQAISNVTGKEVDLQSYSNTPSTDKSLMLNPQSSSKKITLSLQPNEYWVMVETCTLNNNDYVFGMVLVNRNGSLLAVEFGQSHSQDFVLISTTPLL